MISQTLFIVSTAVTFIEWISFKEWFRLNGPRICQGFRLDVLRIRDLKMSYLGGVEPVLVGCFRFFQRPTYRNDQTWLLSRLDVLRAHLSGVFLLSLNTFEDGVDRNAQSTWINVNENPLVKHHFPITNRFLATSPWYFHWISTWYLHDIPIKNHH